MVALVHKKEAWETLQTEHEGTIKVHMSRLQLLRTKFKNMRMKEDKNIGEFNVHLHDNANRSFAIGEKI